MMTPPLFTPWFGPLYPISRTSGGVPYFHFRNLSFFGSWGFKVTDAGHLDFGITPDVLSPISLVAPTPVHAVQINSFSKDPYQGRSTPVPRLTQRWYWSPLLGWCFPKPNEGKGVYVARSSLEALLAQDEETRLGGLKANGYMLLWMFGSLHELRQISPLYLNPQKFSLRPIYETNNAGSEVR